MIWHFHINLLPTKAKGEDVVPHHAIEEPEGIAKQSPRDERALARNRRRQSTGQLLFT